MRKATKKMAQEPFAQYYDNNIINNNSAGSQKSIQVADYLMFLSNVIYNYLEWLVVFAVQRVILKLLF